MAELSRKRSISNAIKKAIDYNHETPEPKPKEKRRVSQKIQVKRF